MGGPPEDPFAPLGGVPGDFVDKPTELEATLDEMMAPPEAREGNDNLPDEAVRFFQEELIPHLRVEDEAVIPAIEKAIGRYGTLVTVVMYDHEEIRRGVLKIEEAPDDLRN